MIFHLKEFRAVHPGHWMESVKGLLEHGRPDLPELSTILRTVQSTIILRPDQRPSMISELCTLSASPLPAFTPHPWSLIKFDICCLIAALDPQSAIPSQLSLDTDFAPLFSSSLCSSLTSPPRGRAAPPARLSRRLDRANCGRLPRGDAAVLR
jgi:hypothetical protein